MAGVTLVVSFARFKSPMAASNVERVLSGPFGCRDMVAIFEACGGRELRVGHKCCEKEPVT